MNPGHNGAMGSVLSGYHRQIGSFIQSGSDLCKTVQLRLTVVTIIRRLAALKQWALDGFDSMNLVDGEDTCM